MRYKRRGAQAEPAESHAGDRGEGEDSEESEGAGGEERQASVKWGRHGKQHVGEDPEAERYPAGAQGGQAVSGVFPARQDSLVPGPWVSQLQGNPRCRAGSRALGLG